MCVFARVCMFALRERQRERERERERQRERERERESESESQLQISFKQIDFMSFHPASPTHDLMPILSRHGVGHQPLGP